MKKYIKASYHTMDEVDAMEELIVESMGYEGYYESVSRALNIDTKSDIYEYIIRVYELNAEEDDENEDEEDEEDIESNKKICATEYVDVYNLADDSQFTVKPADIQDLLKQYEGNLENKVTGWTGSVKAIKPKLSYPPDAIIFGLDFGDEIDYIYLYPAETSRRSSIMYMGAHGMPKFTNSIDGLRRILDSEFREFRRN